MLISNFRGTNEVTYRVVLNYGKIWLQKYTMDDFKMIKTTYSSVFLAAYKDEFIF